MWEQKGAKIKFKLDIMDGEKVLNIIMGGQGRDVIYYLLIIVAFQWMDGA